MDYKSIQDAANGWWHRYKEDRGALASVRRLPMRNVAMAPATIDFWQLCSNQNDEFEQCVAAAHVVSLIRETTDEHPMRQLGPGGFSDDAMMRATLKNLRFRRLMNSREPETMARIFADCVRLSGGVGSPGHYAASMIRWTDNVRRTWNLTYYGA